MAVNIFESLRTFFPEPFNSSLATGVIAALFSERASLTWASPAQPFHLGGVMGHNTAQSTHQSHAGLYGLIFPDHWDWAVPSARPWDMPRFCSEENWLLQVTTANKTKQILWCVPCPGAHPTWMQPGRWPWAQTGATTVTHKYKFWKDQKVRNPPFLQECTRKDLLKIHSCNPCP